MGLRGGNVRRVGKFLLFAKKSSFGKLEKLARIGGFNPPGKKIDKCWVE